MVGLPIDHLLAMTNKPIYIESVTQAELDALIVAHENFVLGKNGGKRLNLPMCQAMHMDFSGHNLRNAEFPGTNLSGSNFMRTNLASSNMFGANIQDCDMRFADLTNADLRGAILRGANFTNAKLKNTDMREGHVFSQVKGEESIQELRKETLADFQAANFSKASFEGAKLGKGFGKGSDLSYANFKNTRLNQADLSNSNLRGANFEGADLSGTNLSKTDLKGANLMGAKLNGTKFEESDITTTKIDIKNLVGIDLSSAKKARKVEDLDRPIRQIIADHLEWVESLGRSGKQAKLADFDLGAQDFMKTDLSAAIFNSLIIPDSDFSNGKLTMATLSTCTLDRTRFVNATMQGVNFSESSMIKADLSLAQAGKASLTYGGRTIEKPSLFRMANLTMGRFIKANLAGADFTNADLSYADFTGATLEGAIFDGAHLKGAVFKESNCKNARLDQALELAPGQIPRIFPE